MATTLTTTHRVSPMYDGRTVLPHVTGWPALRDRLPATVELGTDFFNLPIGRQYLRQMSALHLNAEGAAVRIEPSEEGLTATLLLRSPMRTIEDRWELELDVHGLIQSYRSDHFAHLQPYAPADFSTFFDSLLRAI